MNMTKVVKVITKRLSMKNSTLGLLWEPKQMP